MQEANGWRFSKLLTLIREVRVSDYEAPPNHGPGVATHTLPANFAESPKRSGTPWAQRADDPPADSWREIISNASTRDNRDQFP